MRPAHISCKSGRMIVNALPAMEEVSLVVDYGRGTAGVVMSLAQAAELNCAITAAIRAARKAAGMEQRPLPKYPECER